jgi:transcriptional regulator with XRE-family HTH domain
MLQPTGDQFADLLTTADVSQAAFARLAGVSPRQVNKWCRDRAKVPLWATLLAVVLQDQSVEALTTTAEEILLPPALREPADT